MAIYGSVGGSVQWLVNAGGAFHPADETLSQHLTDCISDLYSGSYECSSGRYFAVPLLAGLRHKLGFVSLPGVYIGGQLGVQYLRGPKLTSVLDMRAVGIPEVYEWQVTYDWSKSPVFALEFGIDTTSSRVGVGVRFMRAEAVELHNTAEFSDRAQYDQNVSYVEVSLAYEIR